MMMSGGDDDNEWWWHDDGDEWWPWQRQPSRAWRRKSLTEKNLHDAMQGGGQHQRHQRHAAGRELSGWQTSFNATPQAVRSLWWWQTTRPAHRRSTSGRGSSASSDLRRWSSDGSRVGVGDRKATSCRATCEGEAAMVTGTTGGEELHDATRWRGRPRTPSGPANPRSDLSASPRPPPGITRVAEGIDSLFNAQGRGGDPVRYPLNRPHGGLMPSGE